MAATRDASRRSSSSDVMDDFRFSEKLLLVCDPDGILGGVPGNFGDAFFPSDEDKSLVFSSYKIQ